MGGCLSGDVRGGMEAVGGGGGARSRGSAQGGGPNDAVDHFFQAQGLRGLYTPLEVQTLPHGWCWLLLPNRGWRLNPLVVTTEVFAVWFGGCAVSSGFGGFSLL